MESDSQNTNGDKSLYNRRSIRLKGYDYSKTGAYFITICIKDRICLFGKIENDEMILNDSGIIINKWWQKISEKFPDIELGNYQIMPNHFHAIIINNGAGNPVGANPRVRPKNETSNVIIGQTPKSAPTVSNAEPILGEHMEPILGEHMEPILGEQTESTLGEHMGSPLHRVVQWFKTMTTNEYIRGVKSLGWTPFNGKLWQRNYYEHIIRDERAYNNIANYIINNPAKWKDDKFNVK